MSTRVGLIVPSSNTVAEVDFYRRLPAGATLHTARMYLEETTPEANPRCSTTTCRPRSRIWPPRGPT